MDLWKYEGKQVKILDTDGDIFVGYADIYHDADDAANGIAALTCIPLGGTPDMLIDFEESEIASIEIVASNVSAMAVAI